MYPTVVIRHPKERVSKCSLQPLKGRVGIQFYKATDSFRFDATGFILLAVDAPLLTMADAMLDEADAARLNIQAIVSAAQMQARPLLLLDSTWRLLHGYRPSFMASQSPAASRRCLPHTRVSARLRTTRCMASPQSRRFFSLFRFCMSLTSPSSIATTGKMISCKA